jgi:hypothetical protein
MSANPLGFPQRPSGGVAFFDLASVTGWAIVQPGGDDRPICGAWALKGVHEDGSLFASLYEALCDFIEWFRPSRLYMEAPLPPGAIKSNMDAWLTLIGLVAVARLAGSHTHGKTIRTVPVSQVRAEVLKGYQWRGNKDKDKPVIMMWARDHGFAPADHNAADALVGLEYCLRTYHGKGFVRDLAQG